MSLFEIDFAGVPDDVETSCWIEFEAADGAPFDWAGKAFELRLGARRGDGAPLLTLTQASGAIEAVTADGASRLIFHFRPAVLEALEAGRYLHDLVYVEAGATHGFARGTLTLLEGVTA